MDMDQLKIRRSSIPFVPTKLRHEVPVVFREPNVQSGFREPHHPWTYYIFSIFQVHNECINVWTHLIAFVLVVIKTIRYCDELDMINDRYCWPFLAGIIATLLMYLCSSGAHCLQSKSEITHYFCFMVDYAGIGLYGFGCAQLHITYCSHESLYQMLHPIYIPLALLFGFLTCFACVRAKIKYQRPYPFMRKFHQIGSVMSMYIWLIVPVVHRIYYCYFYESHCSSSFPSHARQIACFLLSGLFYASDIPQKFIPGKCDFIGHSHQIFHFFIAMCSYYKLEAVRIDYIENVATIKARPAPTFFDAFGPLLVLVTFEVMCIAIYKKRIYEKVARESEVSKHCKKS